MVEDVEEVPPDLEFHSLAVEVRDLRYRDIRVGSIRTAERIAAKVPIRAEGRIKGGRTAVVQSQQWGPIECSRIEIEITRPIIDRLESLRILVCNRRYQVRTHQIRIAGAGWAGPRG